jgi:hypothetical protein
VAAEPDGADAARAAAGGGELERADVAQRPAVHLDTRRAPLVVEKHRERLRRHPVAGLLQPADQVRGGRAVPVRPGRPRAPAGVGEALQGGQVGADWVP